MNGLRAPDIPAYWSYGIVLFVGSVVALVSVNTLLAEKRDRWSYFVTWVLVGSYALLPVALFWFLDYQGVVADTSLFAALVIAVAYQQVLAGAVEGIRLPGQTAAIWGLFKVWVDRASKHIDGLNQARNSRLTEKILTSISSSEERTLELESLVFDRCKPTSTVGTDVNAIRAAADVSEMARRRRIVKRLWDELRVTEPDMYGDLLRANRLINVTTYWWTFRNVRSISVAVMMALLVAGAGYVAFVSWQSHHEDVRLSFYEWRFTRPSITAADEVRARKELLIELRSPSQTALGSFLTESLTFRDVPVDTAQRILDFLLLAHDRETTTRLFSPLVKALQTPNPDVRARLQRMLLELQHAEFPNSPLTGEFEDLSRWRPSKDDSAGQIDAYIQGWLKWRNSAGNVSIESQLVTHQVVTLQDVLFFKSGDALLTPAADTVLKAISDTLAKHRELELLIVGYTDDVGSVEFNNKLSVRRAEAVVKGLTDLGVDRSRLIWLGEGKQHLIVRAATEDARKQNRRVEIARLDHTAPTSSQR
jgi:outer membrane protein OmpA-like peptidoglycan-associated protein